MNRVFGTVLIVTLLGCQSLLAQTRFSPYTISGLGDWLDREMSHNASMGEVGIGTPFVWNINSLNPALLVANDLTVFEMAVEGENRGISGNNANQKISSAGYRYIDFAFPIKPGKWTSNFAVRPKTVVNYQFTSERVVPNGNATNISESQGEGGLTEVNFANGFRIYKGIYVGVRASYLFGLTEHKNTSFLDGTFEDQFPLSALERTNYRGFTYGFGAAYGGKIGGKDSDKSLGLGLIYELAKDLEGDRIIDFAAETTGGSRLIGDTTDVRTDVFSMPSKLGIGFSYMKANLLTVALDITHSNWDESPGFGSDNETYRSTFKIGTGVEFIPDFDNIDKYFARVRYRLGVTYEELPYVIEGQNLNDVGINFGWSLPVRRASFLNMAFKVGARGTRSNNLIEERYFKFMLGATINDRWFVRRRYN